MYLVHDVVAELDGNGYNQRDILEISNELTQFAIMKDEVSSILEAVYDQDELHHCRYLISKKRFPFEMIFRGTFYNLIEGVKPSLNSQYDFILFVFEPDGNSCS